MGERSPIIDVEHTYLYSPATMSAIFRRNSFDVLEVGRVWNDYSLRYLARLAPIPRRPQALLLKSAVIEDRPRYGARGSRELVPHCP